MAKSRMVCDICGNPLTTKRFRVVAQREYKLREWSTIGKSLYVCPLCLEGIFPERRSHE